VIPARVSVVTVGVRDLPAVRGFYEALGWRSHTTGEDFARFETGGAVLTLYSLELLAHEANLPVPAGARFRGVTLAVNVEREELVDEAIEAARGAGGTILAEPVAREWGGRSAYFSDPEGNVWEVAWLPGAAFDERDGLIWPSEA
jgi:catechol 2,3-dioxygenase-like lactoylglutathione lyase family enzyme